MTIKSFLLKAGTSAVPLLLALALGGAQPVLAGGPTIVVATTLNPTNCGKYHTAQSTDLVATLNAAKKGKVLVCPGDYQLDRDIIVDGAKGLTIRQAVKGAGNRPHIMVRTMTRAGLLILNSANVTIDGLVIDGAGTTSNLYDGIRFDHAGGRVNNTTLLGSATTNSGITAANFEEATMMKIAVTKTEMRGFLGVGILATGAVRLTVSSSLIDASDSGRVPSFGLGILYAPSNNNPVTPTGSVSKTTFRNNDTGIYITESSKVTVSKNTFADNRIAIGIISNNQGHQTSNNKILNNTISGIPDDGFGVWVFDIADPAQFPMLKNVISKNVITSANPNGQGVGIGFFSPAPSTKTMTGTVSGNKISGFMTGNGIFNFNNFAGVTIKNNTVSP